MRNKFADHNSGMIDASEKLTKLYSGDQSWSGHRTSNGMNRFRYRDMIMYLIGRKSDRDNYEIHKNGWGNKNRFR